MTEHEQYDAGYNECSHSLNELLRRLTRCSDASGDRRDIENMQAKLQVRHLFLNLYLIFLTCIFFKLTCISFFLNCI